MSRAMNAVIAAGFAALLSLQAVLPAAAQSKTPTAEELVQALRAKPMRSVQSADGEAAAPAQDAKAIELIERLRNKTSRGLSASAREREELAPIIVRSSSVNLEILFEFNSDKITPEAEPALASLGRALLDGEIADSDILVAGHTDAKGSRNYNLTLSQRRAKAVREYLIKNFDVPASRLIPVGYGFEKLKNEGDPLADENRRVQIVNLGVNDKVAQR